MLDLGSLVNSVQFYSENRAAGGFSIVSWIFYHNVPQLMHVISIFEQKNELNC